MSGNRRDLIARGERGSVPLGTAFFIGLRLLDPLLQRYILLKSPLSVLAPRLGFSAHGDPPSGGSILSFTGLTPFQSLIWGFSVGSAAKHIFWILGTCQEPLYPSAAIAVGVFNTVFNTVNSLAFTLASDNPSYSPYDIHFGASLYLVGILTETVGEVQRKRFKDKPENQGKICKSGLYSVVRNVSYLGYTLWRTGYAFASGGSVFGTAVASFFIYDFATRAIPVMDSYMTQKYGKQWTRTKQEVPYALIPGIW
jgi:protein-S-isoprenylcysteine O-methyltransferase Ste14